MSEDSSETRPRRDFLRNLVREDLEAGRHDRVVTRFPPEPNGYLHIGHAKAICVDFGIAREFGGSCHLRFDDTNPETEDPRYVEAIKRDVRWLGFDWGEHEYYASDYFERLYDWAVELIEKGAAYVDDSSEQEIREGRGTISEPGRPSPYRDRSVAENLDLFARMRAGEFPDGSRVLRAKIDLAHPNMKLRDPLMYRIRHAHHYRRGDDWCIYPFYDWAHGQSDAIEGVTHSLCTLEFESNRELYDWYLEHLDIDDPPRQHEFARLNVDYLVTSKRKLLRLVSEGVVDGWDDPRMPTLAGMRRRGYRPEAIRAFCDLVGVAKSDNQVELSMLEYAVRDDLNTVAPRVLCVLDPVRVVLSDWPEGKVDLLEAAYWPHDIPREGSRELPFGRELWIERADFSEDPPKGFHRLSPGREVRLRYGYVIRCEEVVRDDSGEIVELRCTHDPDSRGGAPSDGRRVKGTIHWVSAAHAVGVAVRLYDRLFTVPDPGAGERDLLDDVNPESLVTIDTAWGEPGLVDLGPGQHVQFERQGYFFTDPEDSEPGEPVFNRVVTLRDAWARQQDEPAASGAQVAERRDPRRSEVAVVGTRSEERDAVRDGDPELARRFAAYRDAGVSEENADVLTGDRAVADLFDAAVAAGAPAPTAANRIVQEVLPAAGEAGVAALKVDGAAIAELVGLVEDGTLSSNLGVEVLREVLSTGERPAEVVDRRGLRQIADRDALAAVVDEVIAAHPDKAAEYRGGRTGLLGFFMGQAMARTGGKAKPELVQALLRERLATDSA